MRNSRRTAAFIVARWLATKEFPSALLPDDADRPFVQDLVYTVIRRLRALRHILGALVTKWPAGELEALLYVGAAQVLYMDDVPDFAAVNETVNAAKSCGNPSIVRVVNGVLRNLVRRRDELLAGLAAAPLAERESFPSALVRRWQARFGEDRATALCRWHNTPAETYLAHKDGCFTTLERGRRVSEAPGFATGEFIVQDPATRLAIELLDIHPGESVLDACAAPGGKTIQIAWHGAQVVACEVSPKRRARLKANLDRVGLGAVELLDTLELGSRTFDKILVDAPCSNTGVLRRRPDARWNWSEEKLASLVALQTQILDQSARLLSPRGVLVYSTCSNEPEENLAQVEAFVARHTGFTLVEARESLPFESGTDGAFAAKLCFAGEKMV